MKKVNPASTLTYHLGAHTAAAQAALRELSKKTAMERIWKRDHAVWKPEPAEIANRLGWLDSPSTSVEQVRWIRSFVESCRGEGLTHALLLGMGGSSLAPEVFARVFGPREGYLSLSILDSTDPAAVIRATNASDPRHTLYLVSTKSGTTPETLSFFRHFFNLVRASVGQEDAGKHFAAVTDPGSPLEKAARDLRFRGVFLNDPSIGGRYSALSLFGLVPAALMGVDVDRVLERGATMAVNCGPWEKGPQGANTGAALGSAMGALALEGVDKLTIIASPKVSALGAWIEQLVAESTGKEGKGILPVEGEPLGPPGAYGRDRLFVYLRMDEDTALDGPVEKLQEAGLPVISLRLLDPYDVASEFFRWEMATAVAGAVMGINPFDQPDVESAKRSTRGFIETYQAQGHLPSPPPTWLEDGLSATGDVTAPTLAEAIRRFLDASADGDYVAIQAYVDPSPSSAAALSNLRTAIAARTRLAVTAAFGPRFLHSTGQLHKGDRGNGLFLQIVSADAADVPIPDETGGETSAITFGTLKAAQALGDRQALLDAGRRVFRVQTGPEAALEIGKLAGMVGGEKG